MVDMPLPRIAANISTLPIVFFLLCHSMASFSQVIEKNYLTTDKDIYAPKDTIWFKGYVFDMNNALSKSSIAYHVLMVDADGTKKIDTSWPINGGVTDGYFIAPNNEGRFRIVSLSGQMIGSDPDQLFSKDIFVRSDLADEIEVLAFPQFEEFSPNQENLVDVFTQFSTNAIAPEVKLTYQILSGGQRLKRGRLETSEKGKVTLDLKGIKTAYSDLTLVIESEDKRLTKPVKLAVPIPVAQQQIDLQFFPEGGQLINGMINKVAFKAIDENGNPFDFKGTVEDEKGNKLTSLESLYAGMGTFQISPKVGQKYFLQLLDSSYMLPIGQDSGVALSLADINGDGNKYALIKASPDLRGQGARLVLSKNDRQVGTLNFKFSNRSLWKIPFENMHVGVYRLTILNQANIPLAERLLFANPDESLNVTIETDKKEYQPREKVTATLTVKDHQGAAVQGNFSFGAMDSKMGKSPMAEQPNLMSQILLKSELKGEIPTPNFYFSNDPDALPALDLVMLTNGWRKYGPSTIEDPEGLIGSLHKTNSNRRLLNDREITLASFRSEALDSFRVDASGIFRIPSTYLREKGDSFLVFSEKLNKKDKFSIRQNQTKRIQKGKAFSGYLKNQLTEEITADLGIYKKEHKLRPDQFQNTLLLNSVVVESGKILFTGGCELEPYHFENPWTTKTVNELDMTNDNIIGLLKQVSPIVVKSGKWWIFNDALLVKDLKSGGLTPSRLHINCIPVALTEPLVSPPAMTIEGDYKFKSSINRIDLSNLESISINSEFIPYPGWPPDFSDWIFPIININTVNDQVIYKPIFDMKFFHATYQNYTKAFYSPSYETEKERKDPVPDLRTTIFWQANVFTDENGQATISYYNADRPNQIQITIEGVDAFSRLGFGTTMYQVLEGPETEEKGN